MFLDRHDAAVRLAEMLSKHRDDHCVVLAIPRGGVPIGAVIARSLDCPLDISLSKKIGHPYNMEYAIGSVTMNNVFLEKDLGGVTWDYIRRETREIQKALENKHKFYTGESKTVKLKDRVVIIVDDGIATGFTVEAAVDWARKENPKKVVIAVPVCSASAAKKFTELADEFICPLVPEYFRGVGQFYYDFSQVSDDEVIRLLEESRRKILS